MIDLLIIIVASVGFLAGIIAAFAVMSGSNRLDDGPTTVSADEWWRDAERIKAAIKAAQDEGIERAKIPKLED